MSVLVIKIIGLIIVALGVIGICDARDLSRTFFSNSDKNSSSTFLKILGFIVAIIGATIVYLSK